MLNREIVDKYIDIDKDEGSLFIGDVNCEKPIKVTVEIARKAKKVMQRRNLTKLNVGDPFVKDQDVSFLREFQFLEALSIGFDNFDVSVLDCCSNLKELNIPFGFTGSIDFTRFKNLKSVHVNWENSGVESLFDCSQLERVSIMKYSGLSLRDFEALPNLRELILYEPEVVSLEGIGSLKKLERFEVSIAKKLKELRDIENLSSLQRLFLHGAKDIEDLTPIMYLENLQVLNLDNLGRIPTIKFLRRLKQLEEFYMAGSTNVEDGDLSVLEYLRENHKLVKVSFPNRSHYTHTREQLGFKVPPSVAAIFKKKKK